jgi:hypothetical protein
MVYMKTFIHKKLFSISKKYSRRGLYEFIRSVCSEMPNTAAILNVGAGGDVETLIKSCSQNKDWKITSIDVDPARKPDVLGSIEDVHLPNGRYDAIFAIEVLEHVGNVPAALANCRRMLASDGSLCASVPFMLPIHDAPYDYCRFTEHGLRRLFSEFTSVAIMPRNGYFESCTVVAMRSLATQRGSHWIVMLIAAICILLIAPLARAVDKLVPISESTTGYTIRCCY